MAGRNIQGEIDIDAMSTTRSYNVYEVGNSNQQHVPNANLQEVDIDPNEPRYTFSNSQNSGIANAAQQSVGNGPIVNASHTRGSVLGIKVAPDAIGTKSYGGSYRRWPGIVLFLILIAMAIAAMVYFGDQTYTESKTRGDEFAKEKFSGQQITGGKNKTDDVTEEDIISDDGVIGNPKKYPEMGCELPNYLSKDGTIVAVSENGTEVPISIKGINWFGMETGQAVPFGLWDNSENGTTAYAIANFLHANKFNAVRLPLMVQSILNNREPNRDMVNEQENRAISIDNYMSLLQGILKALSFRRIGVLLSMHTLTDTDSGKLWYNEDISEENFLEAIDILTENLCSQEYWNVMGIDLKNEPYRGTWGTETATDFRQGAQLIANRMLKGCDKWLGFVEGVNAQHTITIDGEDFNYYDWYGGGLQGAKTAGLEFDLPNKVVWAPHYYTPAVFPQYYLYGGGKVGAGGLIDGYVELDDETLKHRIDVTMDDMFGFLADPEGPALLLGEFGGLYSKDVHPMQTTKRCTDFTIELIQRPGWAGGFVWSLNPESAYQFNPADTPGHYTEGILEDDWLTADPDFLGAMSKMDEMPNLKSFPCFPSALSSSASADSE